KLKAVSDLSTAIPLQVVGNHLLDVVDEAVRRRRELLRKRHAVLDELLGELLPSWRRTSPAGGLTIWARLPSGDTEVLARLARDRGVDIVPGQHFSVDGSTAQYLRLPFGRTPQVLEEGILRLAEAWRDLESGAASATPSPTP